MYILHVLDPWAGDMASLTNPMCMWLLPGVPFPHLSLRPKILISGQRNNPGLVFSPGNFQRKPMVPATYTFSQGQKYCLVQRLHCSFHRLGANSLSWCDTRAIRLISLQPGSEIDFKC